MKQNDKWINKWGISIKECPNTKGDIKKYVQEKVKVSMWTKQIGRKKQYYITHLNSSWDHAQKSYLGADIKWKAKMLMAQLRTSSHQLRCETGRWSRPKEEWDERICYLCNMDLVETEWHYIMECPAYEDIRVNYRDTTLTVDSLTSLFEEERLAKLAVYLTKIHSRRYKIKKAKEFSLGLCG